MKSPASAGLFIAAEARRRIYAVARYSICLPGSWAVEMVRCPSFAANQVAIDPFS
jgi:hypothetical protein